MLVGKLAEELVNHVINNFVKPQAELGEEDCNSIHYWQYVGWSKACEYYFSSFYKELLDGYRDEYLENYRKINEPENG